MMTSLLYLLPPSLPPAHTALKGFHRFHFFSLWMPNHLRYRARLKLKNSDRIPLSKILLNPCFLPRCHSLLTILNASGRYGGPASNRIMQKSGWSLLKGRASMRWQQPTNYGRRSCKCDEPNSQNERNIKQLGIM